MLAPCTWPRAWGGRRTRPTSAVSFELTDYGRGAASLGSLRPLRRLTIPAHRAGARKAGAARVRSDIPVDVPMRD